MIESKVTLSNAPLALRSMNMPSEGIFVIAVDCCVKFIECCISVSAKSKPKL